MKITVNWEKAWPAVLIAFLAGLPLLLIAGLIRWRLGWLKNIRRSWPPGGATAQRQPAPYAKSDSDRPDPRLPVC
jgi:hypothetical protein